MFNADDVQDRLQVRPFIPVRIITSSGQSYDITHPDLVLVGRRYLIVGTASNDNPKQFETANFVSVMHITDMQTLPNAPSR
jgi:hypothetical protein